jgi:hypothetical protein
MHIIVEQGSVILTGQVTMKCRHGYLKLDLQKSQQWCN